MLSSVKRRPRAIATHGTLTNPLSETSQNQKFVNTNRFLSSIMSFSNTSTGDKPADPYKKANEEEVDLKTKVNDMVDFITKAKFGMMTTHESETNNLVSRCMALAATVWASVFHKQ